MMILMVGVVRQKSSCPLDEYLMRVVRWAKQNDDAFFDFNYVVGRVAEQYCADLHGVEARLRLLVHQAGMSVDDKGMVRRREDGV